MELCLQYSIHNNFFRRKVLEFDLTTEFFPKNSFFSTGSPTPGYKLKETERLDRLPLSTVLIPWQHPGLVSI